MKTNQQRIQSTLIILVASFLFSLLLYQQNFGINILLFSVLTSVVLAVSNFTIFCTQKVILITIAYVITGIAVFFYTSTLSYITNILAFFTLIGSFSNQQSSIYVNWINGIYTSAVAAFTLRFERLHTETENIKKRNINYWYWAKIIGIPVIIVLVFINLYRSGNPKFDQLITNIDFSFINFGWIVFTALGYYLFYNVTHSVTVEPLTALDAQIENELKNEKSITPKKEKSELHLGTILLISLNLLIVLFLVTDVLHLSEIHKMSAPQLSQQVHTGVDALIASNILAIAIILYFFRGSLNFTTKNNALKKLTFSWIFLNLIMVCITAIKNTEYIVSFGFTYKRIGVLFFLLMTAIGLTTTFIKVINIKNLWFLFRKNIQVAFTVFIISSTLNWDKLITYYNINYAEQLDIDYLIELSKNNTFLLKDYAEKQNIKGDIAKKINTKHSKYVKNLKGKSWQEKVFDNYKIQ